MEAIEEEWGEWEEVNVSRPSSGGASSGGGVVEGERLGDGRAGEGFHPDIS